MRGVDRHGVRLRLVLRHLPLLLEVALVAGNAQLDVVADDLAQFLDLRGSYEHIERNEINIDWQDMHIRETDQHMNLE